MISLLILLLACYCYVLSFYLTLGHLIDIYVDLKRDEEIDKNFYVTLFITLVGVTMHFISYYLSNYYQL